MLEHPPLPSSSRPRIRTLHAVCWLLGAALYFGGQLPLQAQSYPHARLDTVTPPGGKIGTTVEVVLSGADLEDITALYFSDGRLKAELVPPPPPDPKVKNPPPHPLMFKVTIPADMPVGIYDVRAVGKWGITNPRAFAVGDLAEVMEKEPNNDVDKAQKVELNTTINGNIGATTDVDYSVFTGKKGQRVLVICEASSIDSKLNPLVEVYTTKGLRLAGNSQYFDRNAVVDCILPDDGDYLVRLSDFAYQAGGAAYFYRLSITTAPWIDAVYPPAVEKGKPATLTLFGRNLPGGKIEPGLTYSGRPMEKAQVQYNPMAMGPGKDNLLDFKGLLLPPTVALEGTEFRVKNPTGSSNPALLTFTDAPVVLANGKNNALDQAQKVNLPCTVCGILEKEGEQDWYSFAGKKGDVLSFECFGDRLGSPRGFHLQVRKVDGKDNPIVATFETNPEFPAPNQGFTFDTEDPKGKFAIPTDGDYLLQVTTHGGQKATGARVVYRVDLNKEKPDFRLLLVENENDHAGSFTVNKGGSQEIYVHLIRQDGFDGEVLLEAEGLPSGVTCVPQVVGPKIKKGTLVVQAAEGAPDSAGPIKIKGTALIDGKAVVRPAQAACVVWPVPPQGQIPAISRLTRSICMAVRDKGPFALTVDTKDLSVPVGGNLEFKINIKRNDPEFKAKVDLVRLSSPVLTNGQFIAVPAAAIDANKNEVLVKFAVPGNTQPGTYSLVFQGKAKFNVTDTKDKKKKKNADIFEATPPVKVIVYDKIAEVVVANPKVAVKAGENAELLVKVNRLNGYQGEYDVTVTVPGGIAGVTVDKAKIPAGANEVKLVLKTAKNASVTTNPNYAVKLTGKVGTLTFNSEAKFEVNIAKAAAALTPPAADPLVRRIEPILALPVLLLASEAR
jgi:hypothetical protein